VKNLLLAASKTVVNRWWKCLFKDLTITFRVHAVFISTVLLYSFALIVTASLLKITHKISFSLYPGIIPLTAMLFLMTFFAGHATYVMVFVRPKKLIRYILNDLQTKYLKRERLLIGLPIILFTPIFMSTFTSFKTLIPIMNPFSWDTAFAKFDEMIHGGFQAWQLYQPILGNHVLTSGLNVFYNLWVFVMFGVLYWQTFSLSDLKLRMQFFLSYLLAWVLLGTIAATIFSSAGPCYYGRVVDGDNIYQPLMEYLNVSKKSSFVWALDTQKVLWKAYKDKKIELGCGISAMPSMHVAMAFLFALVGWRKNRLIGIMFSAYVIIIMLGSVHLGWHYAIDGYAAILGTLLIWRFVGWFLNIETFRFSFS
jgi:hypothetical protein